MEKYTPPEASSFQRHMLRVKKVAVAVVTISPKGRGKSCIFSNSPTKGGSNFSIICGIEEKIRRSDHPIFNL